MADSFQNEIPKARINISLDVETGGSKQKLKLPMKLLVMGDFSNGKTKGRLAERERIRISRNTIDQALSDLAPEVAMSVPNAASEDGGEIDVRLQFRSMNDFRPERVAEQVPEIHNLLAMRNLLKDLKSNLLDNSKFRKELEQVLGNGSEFEALRAELEQLAPLAEPAADSEKEEA